MYNNTDSPVLSGICYAEMQKNRRYRRFFRNMVRVVIQNFLKKPVISTVFKADE